MKSIVSCALYGQSIPFIEKEMRVQNVVTVIARVQRKINLMQGKSIQKSDSNREEAVLESVGVDLRLLYLFPDGRRWKRECPGAWGP